MRHRSGCPSSGNAELADSGQVVHSPPSSPLQNSISNHPSYGGHAFQSDEVPCAILESWSCSDSRVNRNSSLFFSLIYLSALFCISGVAYPMKSMTKLSCLRLLCLVAFQKEHHLIFHTNLIKSCKLVQIEAQLSIHVYLVHHHHHWWHNGC